MDFHGRVGLLAELSAGGRLRRADLEAHHRHHIYELGVRCGIYTGRSAECGKFDSFGVRLDIHECVCRFVLGGRVRCEVCTLCLLRCLPAELSDRALYLRALLVQLMSFDGVRLVSKVRNFERGLDFGEAERVMKSAMDFRNQSKIWRSAYASKRLFWSYHNERVFDFDTGLFLHQHGIDALAESWAVDAEGLLCFVKDFDEVFDDGVIRSADLVVNDLLKIDAAVFVSGVKAAGGNAVEVAQKHQPVKSLNGIAEYVNKTGGFDAVDDMLLTAAKVAAGGDRKSKSFNEIEILALSFAGDNEAYEVYQDLLRTAKGVRNFRMSNNAAGLVGLPKYRDWQQEQTELEAVKRGRLLFSRVVVELRQRILLSVFGNELPAWFLIDFEAVIYALNEALDGIVPEVNKAGELRPASVCERIVSAGILCLRSMVHEVVAIEAPLAFSLETQGKLDDWVEGRMKQVMSRLAEEEEAARPAWLCAPEEVF